MKGLYIHVPINKIILLTVVQDREYYCFPVVEETLRSFTKLKNNNKTMQNYSIVSKSPAFKLLLKSKYTNIK